MNWTTGDLVSLISRKDKEQKKLLIDLLELNNYLLSDITTEAKREIRDVYSEKIEEYRKNLR